MVLGPFPTILLEEEPVRCGAERGVPQDGTGRCTNGVRRTCARVSALRSLMTARLLRKKRIGPPKLRNFSSFAATVILSAFACPHAPTHTLLRSLPCVDDEGVKKLFCRLFGVCVCVCWWVYDAFGGELWRLPCCLLLRPLSVSEIAIASRNDLCKSKACQKCTKVPSLLGSWDRERGRRRGEVFYIFISISNASRTARQDGSS